MKKNWTASIEIVAIVKKDATMKTIADPHQEQGPSKSYRQLSQHYNKLLHIYGLPKVHKDSISLRPIVSCQGSVWNPLSGFLVNIINPFIGKPPSYV